MRRNHLPKLIMSAIFIAMGIVLPFFTGQIPEIGSMLLPMHIPVLFCGLICGWQYGGAVGFILPILRFFMFGMPPIYPTGISMAFEMAVYGIVIGLMYKRMPKNIGGLYLSLLTAMIAGRAVWGAARIALLGLWGGSPFTWEVFMSGAVLTAVPGIILQLVLIPAIMTALEKIRVLRYGSASELVAVLSRQTKLYPEAAAVDYLKLLYQNEFGSGHLITDRVKSMKLLTEEAEALLPSSGNSEEEEGKEDAVEPIGNGLCRLHLRVINQSGLSINTLHRLFELSAMRLRGTDEGFLKKVSLLSNLCRDRVLKIRQSAVKKAVSNWKTAGGGLFRHSDTFRKNYAPAYRVVEKQFCDYLPLLCAIDKLMREGGENSRVVVAVDGRCASGKTTLAAILKLVYECDVIPMDHFFLRPEISTEERMKEVGGNIDYERFYSEVIAPLGEGAAFSYRPYDCETETLGEEIAVTPARLTVIEGSYSLHPKFGDYSSLKVFLTAGKEEQLRRVYARNGAMAERFEKEWIPMEEAYFSAFEIENGCELRFDTTGGFAVYVTD
jgi:uridine kinase/thiamine transporter ThiT